MSGRPSGIMSCCKSLCAVIIALLLQWTHCAHGASFDLNRDKSGLSIRSGKELKEKIYTKLGHAGDWCVQMQTATHVVGCTSQDNQQLLEGLLLWPAHKLKEIQKTPTKDNNKIAAVVQALDAGPFLEKLIWNDSSIREGSNAISALLILASNKSLGSLRWNFADKGPLLKSNTSYGYHEWNPNGLGLLKATFDYPIVQLSQAETQLVADGAELNVLNQGKSNSPLYRIDINYVMEGKDNSIVCIRDRTCLPIGGLSILSSPVSSNGRLGNLASPVIMVTARMDSNGPFHKLLRGFNDPRSGLVAMLVAARMVGQVTHLLSRTSSLEKRIIFAAIQGDAFDLMGSRRLLVELHRDKGLQEWLGIQSDQPLDVVDAILGVGPIARAVRLGDNHQIYAHQNPQERSQGKVSSAIIETMIESCQVLSPRASLSLHQLQSLSPTEHSFVQARSDLPIISISEYREEFLNHGSLSQFGDYRTDGMMSEEFNIDIIADFAAVLAHTLLQISFPSAKKIDINQTQVTSDTRILVDCLMQEEEEKCTADQMMPVGGPFGGLEQSYVGILRSFITSESLRTLSPRYQAPVERFVWNWLAAGMAPVTTDSSSHRQLSQQACSSYNASSCPDHTVCGGVAASDGFATCVENPPIFVPAFSEAFFYNTTEGRWNVHDNVTKNDPMWTESNWPSGTPDLSIYLSESRATEAKVFIAGITCTSLVMAAAFTAQVLWDRRSKID